MDDAYAAALARLDAIVDAAERNLDRAETSELVRDLFPHRIDEARVAVTIARQARDVAAPGWVAWVATGPRSKAHAVADIAGGVALCGRDIAGGTEDRDRDRCTRCVRSVDERDNEEMET